MGKNRAFHSLTKVPSASVGPPPADDEGPAAGDSAAHTANAMGSEAKLPSNILDDWALLLMPCEGSGDIHEAVNAVGR